MFGAAKDCALNDMNLNQDETRDEREPDKNPKSLPHTVRKLVSTRERRPEAGL